MESDGTALPAIYVNYLVEHAQLLELSEGDGNYIVSYSGSGDDFKKVVYGHLVEAGGMEFYEDFIAEIKEALGTYELTIDKSSFHVKALTINVEKTIEVDGYGSIHSKGKTHMEYSDFNNVKVTIPDEVK